MKLHPADRLTVLLLLAILWAGPVRAKVCPEGSYGLGTQSEIDALGATGCNVISGTLGIHNDENCVFFCPPSPSPDNFVRNIDALSNITEVGEILTITSHLITDVNGLANLTSVGWIVDIKAESLTNLDGLSALQTIGRGFGSARLSILNNDSLLNINGLAGLTSIGGLVQIASNTALKNIDGLGNVTEIGAGLEVSGNDSLANVDGAFRIQHVGGDLYVRFNPSLTNCEGLAPLLGWPDGLDQVKVDGRIFIQDNGAGCSSVEEILSSVTGPTQPEILSHTTTSSSARFEFEESYTSDFLYPILGYRGNCISSPSDASEQVDINVRDSASAVIRTLEVSDYDPTTVTAVISMQINVSHTQPSDLVITLTTPEGTSLTIWDGNETDGEDISGSFPQDFQPIESFDQISEEGMDGIWTLSIKDVVSGPVPREGVLNS